MVRTVPWLGLFVFKQTFCTNSTLVIVMEVLVGRCKAAEWLEQCCGWACLFLNKHFAQMQYWSWSLMS
jgi:hypothetical protein